MNLHDNLTLKQLRSMAKQKHIENRTAYIKARVKVVSDKYDETINKLKDKSELLTVNEEIDLVNSKIKQLEKVKKESCKKEHFEAIKKYDSEMKKEFQKGNKMVASMNPNTKGFSSSFYKKYIKDIFGRTI